MPQEATVLSLKNLYFSIKVMVKVIDFGVILMGFISEVYMPNMIMKSPSRTKVI